MATMTYKDWLAARSRRTGTNVTSTPTEAAAFKVWQSKQPEYQQAQALDTGLYGANPPDPAAAPGAVNTSVDPNDLWNAILKDPDAVQQTNTARQDYTVGGANALANWQNAKNQLAAQLPQFALQQEQGLRNAASNTAARGTAQSGQGELEKQQTRTDYANQVAQNQLQSQQADNAYQTDATNLSAGFNDRYFGAFKDAASRYMTNRLSNFSDTYGINSGLGAQVPTQGALTAQQPPATIQPVKPVVPKQATQVAGIIQTAANRLASGAKKLSIPRRLA